MDSIYRNLPLAEDDTISLGIYQYHIALSIFPFEHLSGKRVQDNPLNCSLKRTCTVGRIVAFLNQ
jgi:hypothetical protein